MKIVHHETMSLGDQIRSTKTFGPKKQAAPYIKKIVRTQITDKNRPREQVSYLALTKKHKTIANNNNKATIASDNL